MSRPLRLLLLGTSVILVRSLACIIQLPSEARAGSIPRGVSMSVQYQKRYFNVDEYYRMAEVGLLSPDDRIELIEGEIVEMSPIGRTRAGTVNRASAFLNRQLGDTVIVSVQNPVRLNDFSEPQPDLALLKPRKDFYSNSHPAPEDVLVMVAVADTSANYDRNVKLPLYARAGIPEAWLMVLPKEVIEVHSQPKNGKYQKVQRLKRGKTLVSTTIPGLSCKIEDLLG